jgi:very-short-patch-repair endonuclease
VSATFEWIVANERARALRKAQTEGERALWQLLRRRQIAGYRFRRQVSIGPFIADFVCLERRVIVEVDGSSHENAVRRQKDIQRDRWLEANGFRVLRLEGGEVLENPEQAIGRVREFLGVLLHPECTIPTPTLPHQGGGR